MAVRDRVPVIEWPRIDRRFLIGGVAAAVAAMLVLVVTQPPPRTPVLVAGSDLPAGTSLAALDVQVRHVQGSEGLIAGSRLGELGTWSLRIPIGAGEPLTPSNVRPPEMISAPNLIALSLPAERAVLGHIDVGDSVDIYFTSADVSGKEQTTERIASDVYVAEVEPPNEGAFGTEVKLLLAVDDRLAQLLASSTHAGEIDLVRVTP